MTERSRSAVTRSATRLSIGPSALEWRDGRLHLTLDEIGAPLPKRIRGTITVEPGARPAHREALDVAGRHRWSVIAPCGRATVELKSPSLSWSGPAYHDHNRGSRALEDDFVRWDWSRAHLADGRAAVLYDVERRSGDPLSLATAFGADGSHDDFVSPPLAALPATAWGLRPSTRSALTRAPTIAMSLEDGPFYARSVIGAEWLGQPVVGVHEHLSLERFKRRWVRSLLPFRMPRRG